MKRSVFLIFRGILAGVLAVHLAGVLVFALAVAIEAADEPFVLLLRELAARVPGLWARAAAVLGLVGAVVATARMRRQGVLLGLGTLGFDPRWCLAVGAIVAALAGAGAGRAEREPPPAPGAWERGEGGWIRDGIAWPDEPGGRVRSARSRAPGVATGLANAAAAGALGGALGLYAAGAPVLVATGVLLVAEVVARGLTERGVLPEWGGTIPAVLAVLAVAIVLARAPRFPRRWG